MEKVAKGQAFKVTAETWNAFIDAARFVQNREIGTHTSTLPKSIKSGIVTISNQSGEDQKQLAILGIDDLAIKPEDDEAIQRFRTEPPVFNCKKLSDIDDSNREIPFVILQEPIADGNCGRAMIEGVSPVKLNVLNEDHEYAVPIIDDTTELETAFAGVFRILWKEDGTGEKWGLVRFPIEDTSSLRIQNNSGETLKEGYACRITAIGSGFRTFVVERPDQESLLAVLPYSGPDLADGETSVIYPSEIMRFAIEDAEGLKAGDFIGTQKDSFLLGKNAFGFLVLAVESDGDTKYAYVRYSGLPPVIRAVSDASDNTIDVKHCDSGGGTEGDTFTLPVIPEDEE